VIETWSEGDADEHMSEAILVELAGLVEAHPWWRARSRLTLELLDRCGVRRGQRVLDVGCGWGVTLTALESAGFSADGLDISRGAMERIDRPDRRLIVADLTKPIPDVDGYDAVLALDVLEHLDDDRAAAAVLGRLVAPGGRVVVSVPALPALYSEFDAVQGHRRRYTEPMLRSVFDDSNLEIEHMFWWGQWMVPLLRMRPKTKSGDSPMVVYRRHLRLPPAPVRAGLRLAYRLEHRLALAGRLRTGTSLFAVARCR
jgi:2-polyprenyl-3-methyl-5-hydroxy-6-metoxy-1,4-benzoquinol methylase